MRIGNPQNMEGKDLLVGISAINADSSFVASDIKTIKAGSNVSLSASGAVLTVNATTSANESATINCFVDITTSSVEDDLVVLSLVDKTVVAIIDGSGRQWSCVGEDEVTIPSTGIVRVDMTYIFNKLNITSIPIGETWQLVITGGV